MPPTATGLSPGLRRSYDETGFCVVPGFADGATCTAMLDRAIELARGTRSDGMPEPLVMAEQQPDLDRVGAPEAVTSKIFTVARDPVFGEFVHRHEVVDLVADLLGTDDVDTFLSQFIFKNPGAWGQPWHQDSYYFPFEPARPIVGVWLAVTEATLENGCLHVLAGSQREPVHTHVPDRRDGANYGYTEIVDHDTSASEPVLMQPGDLLLFDSHLMHRSTDNASDGVRATMVYHYASAGTLDRTLELWGYCINDWIPVRRA